jgi:hypothetical protein
MVLSSVAEMVISRNHFRFHAAGMLKLTLLASLALSTLVAAQPRDGSHDFDFQIGKWKLKIKKLEKPLSGQQKWLEFTGTSTVTPLWGGKAQVEEIEIDSPTAGHLEGMTFRTYSPTGHQWYLNWQNVKTAGAFGPPTVGGFSGGRGEFYDQEDWNGKMILVRDLWTNVTKSSAHFEQSFSDDGGKTWEPNWIADQTRL